jgi:DNA transformation protein and related proteins
MAKATSARVATKNTTTGKKLVAVGNTGLDSLKNLGADAAKMLQDAGIRTRSQLSELGAVGAYVAVKRQGLKPTLNLLYAIEGALRGIAWTDLPYHVRASLTLEADAYLDAEGMR